MAYKYGYRPCIIISNVWKGRTYMRNVNWQLLTTWTVLIGTCIWFWVTVLTSIFI